MDNDNPFYFSTRSSQENIEVTLPKGIRQFNKRLLNRLTGKIARSSFGPFSIIYHVGRRSGKTYETPIIAIPSADAFIVALTYGPEVDWYRNVVASGRCKILWHRHETVVQKIEPMETKEALPYVPLFERKILRFIGTQDFVKMKVQA